jgi:glycosyltransferase involved in cell wall biosynthesis
MQINIVSCDNGVGLSRDARIITEILTPEHDVTFSGFLTEPTKQCDLNIFLELMHPKWLDFARKNVLIPNPEWYDNNWVQYLPRFDMVLAKTRCAEEIFRRRGCPTEFVSFTSYDRSIPGSKKDDLKFFHLAGKSLQKGTEMVIRTWEKNPAFPPLTIVQDPGKWKRRVTSKNVNHIFDHLDEHVLKTLQNAYGVHVCPSETEGFGHYIMEAMSVRALVISTNAPPMNELVTPDRGVVVDYTRRAPQRLATNYYASEATLERGVRSVMSLSDDAKERMRENGRSFYEANDAFFRRTFVDTIRKVLQQ